MSYCVNCGVELDNSLKKCVLCDTPVINPNVKNEIEEISRDDILVTADMNGITSAGTYKLDLNITTPSGVTVLKKSTSEISVSVDKIRHKNELILSIVVSSKDTHFNLNLEFVSANLS